MLVEVTSHRPTTTARAACARALSTSSRTASPRPPRHVGQLEVDLVNERYLHALERHEYIHAGRLLVALDLRQRLVIGEENDSLAVVHIGDERHGDDTHDELRRVYERVHMSLIYAQDERVKVFL